MKSVSELTLTEQKDQTSDEISVQREKFWQKVASDTTFYPQYTSRREQISDAANGIFRASSSYSDITIGLPDTTWYKMPAPGWRAYAEAGWRPPQALIDGVMQGGLLETDRMPIWCGSGCYRENIIITDACYQRIQGNRTRRFGKFGYLVRVVNESTNEAMVVDVHDMSETINQAKASIAPFGPLMWRGQNVTDAFWNRIEKIEACATKEIYKFLVPEYDASIKEDNSAFTFDAQKAALIAPVEKFSFPRFTAEEYQARLAELFTFTKLNFFTQKNKLSNTLRFGFEFDSSEQAIKAARDLRLNPELYYTTMVLGQTLFVGTLDDEFSSVNQCSLSKQFEYKGDDAKGYDAKYNWFGSSQYCFNGCNEGYFLPFESDDELVKAVDFFNSKAFMNNFKLRRFENNTLVITKQKLRFRRDYLAHQTNIGLDTVEFLLEKKGFLLSPEILDNSSCFEFESEEMLLYAVKYLCENQLVNPMHLSHRGLTLFLFQNLDLTRLQTIIENKNQANEDLDSTGPSSLEKKLDKPLSAPSSPRLFAKKHKETKKDLSPEPQPRNTLG
jgi:hypothetical protein